MKALKVEFAPPRRVPSWVLYLASALLLAVAAQQGREAWRLHQQAKSVEAEIAVLRLKIEQAQQAQREALERSRAEPPYAKDLAEIARVAAFPIERVFASIESARVVGVRLTALDVSPPEGTARAELEFSDHDALLSYLDAINAGEEKRRWTLVQAQLGSGGSANTATISSKWE
jgi:hypothetical protein